MPASTLTVPPPEMAADSVKSVAVWLKTISPVPAPKTIFGVSIVPAAAAAKPFAAPMASAPSPAAAVPMRTSLSTFSVPPSVTITEAVPA